MYPVFCHHWDAANLGIDVLGGAMMLCCCWRNQYLVEAGTEGGAASLLYSR